MLCPGLSAADRFDALTHRLLAVYGESELSQRVTAALSAHVLLEQAALAEVLDHLFEPVLGTASKSDAQTIQRPVEGTHLEAFAPAQLQQLLRAFDMSARDGAACSSAEVKGGFERAVEAAALVADHAAALGSRAQRLQA
jgi:hypothetical protein